MHDAIIDVDGIKVGHASDFNSFTGCTVILPEKGCVGGADVRGGAPGTREIALLDPRAMVCEVNGIMLAGGGAFGLEAACGAMDYLEEKGIGFDVGVTRVPIVPSAVLFDLTCGDFRIRPDRRMGYKACLNARDDVIERGSVGAGTGATIGKIFGMGSCMKSGIGSASIKAGEVVVGAIFAVNAFGDVYDLESGGILAGALNPDRRSFADTVRLYKELAPKMDLFPCNTTIGVVATNAKLTKSEINKVAQMAHDGLARSIRPVHTSYDGDTIFALATGVVEGDVTLVGVVGADATARAVDDGVRSAKGLGGIPSARDLDL